MHERQQFGQAIRLSVKAKLADMYVTMNAAKSYVYTVAKLATKAVPPATPPRILYAAERAT